MKFKLLLLVSCSLFLTGCSLQEAQLQASKVWNTITGKSTNTGEITGAQLSGTDQETMDFSESSGSTITGAQNIELSGSQISSTGENEKISDSQSSSTGENEKIFNSLQSGGLSIGVYNGNNKSLYGNSRVLIEKLPRNIRENINENIVFISKNGENSNDLKDYKIDRFIPFKKESFLGSFNKEEILKINKDVLIDNMLYLDQVLGEGASRDVSVIKLDLEAKKLDIISTGGYPYYTIGVVSKNWIILQETRGGIPYDVKLKNINNGKEFPLDGKKQGDFTINEKENTLSYNEYKEVKTYLPDENDSCKGIKNSSGGTVGGCENGKAYESDIKPTGKIITKSLDEFK